MRQKLDIPVWMYVKFMHLQTCADVAFFFFFLDADLANLHGVENY